MGGVVTTAVPVIPTTDKFSPPQAPVQSVVSHGSVLVQQDESDDDVVYVSPTRVAPIVVDLTEDD